MFLEVFWMSFLWISLRLLDGLNKYQEPALLVLTKEKSATSTYISKSKLHFLYVIEHFSIYPA